MTRYKESWLGLVLLGLLIKPAHVQENLLSTTVYPHFLRASLAVSDLGRLEKLQKRLRLDDLVQKNQELTRQDLEKISQHPTTPIPKLFHYVWVGGPLYKEYWQSMAQMAVLLRKAKSSYRIHVWVDSPKNIEWLKEKQSDGTRIKIRNGEIDCYRRLFGTVLNIKEIKDLKTTPPSFLTPEQYEEYWNIINFELHGLKNLAALVDFLRIEILRQQGGIYQDTDLIKMFFTLVPGEEGLIFPLNFKIIDDNNCWIASTPNHPILNAALRFSLIHYFENFADIQEKRRTDKPPKPPGDKQGEESPRSKRVQLTLEIAGPKLFHRTIMGFIQDERLRKELILSSQEVPSPQTSLTFSWEICQSFERLRRSLPREIPQSRNRIKPPNRYSGLFWGDQTILGLEMLDLFYNLLNHPRLTVEAFQYLTFYIGRLAWEIANLHSKLMSSSFLLLVDQGHQQGQILSQKAHLSEEEVVQNRKVFLKLVNSLSDHLQTWVIKMRDSDMRNLLSNTIYYIEFSQFRFFYRCDHTWFGQPYTMRSFDNDNRHHDEKFYKIPS